MAEVTVASPLLRRVADNEVPGALLWRSQVPNGTLPNEVAVAIWNVLGNVVGWGGPTLLPRRGPPGLTMGSVGAKDP